ncbi:hypothetical protein AB0M22_41725 [Nocardia sp. NPDC051756]|uniref:hypothetical protein n=1 Tax=Nocardia sp. NPDC051756 TaxID=3154751 RepID=UPI00341B413F
MSPIVAGLTAILVGHILTFFGLWLRLRWRVAQHHVRHRYMIELASILPEGSRIDEQDSDGQRTRMSVGSTAAERDHG